MISSKSRGEHKESAIKKTIVPGLDIITTNTNLAASEIELVSVEKREFVISDILSNTINFDFVLIDCPPALGLLTINSLVASNSVIVPLQSEFFALEGITQLIKTIDRIKVGLNPNLSVRGILLTMFDKRNFSRYCRYSRY